MIQISNLTKTYEDVVVLNAITAAMPQGKITIILGENGSGKSTLLSIIGRFLQQSHGSVTLDGLDHRHYASKTFAQKIASLRQTNPTIGKISVTEFVSYARHVHNDKTLQPQDHEIIAKSIEKMGCADLQDRYLTTLSGGQLQRVYLAAIFAQDTDYILLDEPLNNLDIKHAHALMQRIQQIAKDEHKTVIITMHDINMALRYGDYALALKGGELIHQGPSTALVNLDILQAVFEMEFEIFSKGDRHYVMAKEETR